MLSRIEEYNNYYRGKPNKGYAPMVERLIVHSLEPYPKATILDLGCGVGNNIKYLSEVWKDSVFTGVDISDVAIETAKSKVPSAIFFCDSIEHIDLINKYDIIFLIGVLEHLQDMTDTFEKVRLLSSGVVFVRTVYNAERSRGYLRPGFGDNQTEWNLSRIEWEEKFKMNGFEIVQQVTGLGLVPGRDLAWMLKKD
jgi:2-polyprenyl-3-methyl-5-hydroxy-6-metoxy-1,4-benzoquinol methylase